MLMLVMICHSITRMLLLILGGRVHLCLFGLGVYHHHHCLNICFKHFHMHLGRIFSGRTWSTVFWSCLSQSSLAGAMRTDVTYACLQKCARKLIHYNIQWYYTWEGFSLVGSGELSLEVAWLNLPQWAPRDKCNLHCNIPGYYTSYLPLKERERKQISGQGPKIWEHDLLRAFMKE